MSQQQQQQQQQTQQQRQQQGDIDEIEREKLEQKTRQEAHLTASQQNALQQPQQ